MKTKLINLVHKDLRRYCLLVQETLSFLSHTKKVKQKMRYLHLGFSKKVAILKEEMNCKPKFQTNKLEIFHLSNLASHKHVTWNSRE